MSCQPFVIFALPRSRTYWLSRFLSYGEWSCGHDEARYFRGLDDIASWLSQEYTGTVETAAAPWWRMLQSRRPDARVVVIRRPVEDVVNSILALCPFDRDVLTKAMNRLDAKLAQIAKRWPGALTVQYADLVSEDACKSVFEHCLPHAFDRAWWQAFAPVNLQCSLPALTRYYAAYQPQLEKLGAMAKQEILTHLALKERPDTDGMTIQVEPFDVFLRDATGLFAEHLVEVGEHPDAYHSKNLPMHRQMEENCALEVTTARCNGRMFGYLMTAIAPSLERESSKIAVHTASYASKAVPGLGMRLQRAALKRLKEESVDEVFFRAGVRGSGPRMGSLYRRLGASDDGQMFRLTLREA